MKKIQTAAFGVPEYDMQREGTYRPRISPEHLRRLRKRKQQSGKPITEPVAGNAARVNFYSNGGYLGWAAPILAPGGGGVGLGSPLICLNPNAGQACHLHAGDPKLGQGCFPLLG